METITKSYTCLVDGTTAKRVVLQDMFKDLEELSKFAFENFKTIKISALYLLCRSKFPNLNSKVLQNFLRFSYYKKKAYKIKSPIKPTIYLDYQNFHLEKSESSSFFSHWLRFGRRTFPLRGVWPLEKLDSAESIKLAQIYQKKGRYYCKFSCVHEAKTTRSSGPVVGADVNFKTIVLSSKSFFRMNQLVHRKLEHKKNKRNLGNFTTDFLHKQTSEIAEALEVEGTSCLVLEKLSKIRGKACRKTGHSKGKLMNYLINSWPYHMIQGLLQYKCLEKGIAVVFIEPQYTSQTCHRCGSLKTIRPRQCGFVCENCGYTIHADLNAAQNIRDKYILPGWATVNLALSAA